MARVPPVIDGLNIDAMGSHPIGSGLAVAPRACGLRPSATTTTPDAKDLVAHRPKSHPARAGILPFFTRLDFDIASGGIVVVRGANGSGKSSLLRLAAGYLAPTAGELRRDGVPIADDPERHRTSLHYVGHLDR